jgi:hypothetical protein
MAKFITGQEIKTDTPSIEVTVDKTKPLSPGRHRFQLIVEDDAGNISSPSVVDVVVIDNTRPTAVLEAPATVPFGTSFNLSGERSFDLPPGKIKSYRWLQLS